MINDTIPIPQVASVTGAGGIAYREWLRRLGVSRETGIRWMAKKIITPSVNVQGKHYLTDQDIETFWERAKEGEFAKEFAGICKEEA